MISGSSHRIRVQEAAFLALSVILFATTARAQLASTGIDDDPGSGMRRGTNTIVGRVIYPSGRQLDRPHTVRLSSIVVGEFSTMTDQNGVFTFRRLKEGTYFIRIDAGKEYLPVQETVDLYDNRSQTLNVQIELRPRPSKISKAGVINVAPAGVPKAALDLYQQAITSAKAGETNKAIGQLKSALSVYPQFVVALNEMSVLYLNLGELDKAGEALAEAVKVEPENATLRLNYGYVLMLRERFLDAERELLRAVQLRDDYTLAHLNRGKVLIKLRNFNEAEKELKRVISLGGDEVGMAYRYLGALYSERGDKAKAIEALETYLKLNTHVQDAEQVRAVIKQLRDQSKPQP
ncbi:MAG: tetratricopeptide repeat protein [Pyrinomonadaceae bacterium]